MTLLFGLIATLAALWAASALFVHLRGRERLAFMRQIADHSTFLAPYDAFVYLRSGVPNRPAINRFAIRHVMRATATANVAGDPVGMLNRIFERVYGIRLFAKRIRARSRRTYHVLSYTAKLAPIAALAWLGLRAVAR